SPPRAAIYLGGIAGAVLTLASPQFGMLALSSLMIAQWPGQVLKLGAAGVVGATLLWALARRRRLIPRDEVLLVLAPLILLIWLSALSVGDPSAVRVATSWTGYALYYWAASTLATDERAPRRLAMVFLISGVVTALIGLVQYKLHFTWIITAYTQSDPFLYLGSNDFRDLQIWDGSFRIDSVTGSENYMGVAMQLPIAFACYWLIRRRSLAGRVVGLAMLAVLAAALLLSLTRGAILITAVVVVPMLAAKFGWRRSLPYLLVGAAIMAITFASIGQFRARAAATVDQVLHVSPMTSGGFRISIVPVGLAIIRDHFWTGVGLEQHRWAIRRYAPSDLVSPVESAQLQLHNAYLWIAAELGIFGLLLVGALLALVWRRLRRLQAYYRGSGQRALEDLAHAAEVAWVALIFDMAFYPVVDTIFRYHWVLLAVVAGLTRVALDQGAAPPRERGIDAAARPR
ncbi:MAG: O-antigen ligase family protein, partial [Chloroflexales bacterium]|nr:O-antigen ligase family protein [Chloroflexales bacterium]